VSIDAQVKTVIINEDGSGSLELIDRPAEHGGMPGIAGQVRLRFQTAPEEVTALNGCNIWGDASSILLGSRKIAERIGYTQIKFLNREWFNAAVAEYHRHLRLMKD
jgi:hypothetical protein